MIIAINDEDSGRSKNMVFASYQVLCVSLQPSDDMNCLFWVFHLVKQNMISITILAMIRIIIDVDENYDDKKGHYVSKYQHHDY